jgi:UDP-glucuronate decarboxylase
MNRLINSTETALVAGGAGFIGSHLCRELLRRNYRVICVDNLFTGRRENLTELKQNHAFWFVEHDVVDPLQLDGRLSLVFNLACPASPPHYQADPLHTMMTSVLGTRNLLDLAEKKGARYLQASTSEVYGDPEQHPQREEYWGNVNPVGPRACYDEGKRAAEALCFDVLRLGRADVRVARIFNTYGPRMRADDGRIVSNFITQALAGTPVTIYGSGDQTRSFCYVSDLVEGLIALISTPDNPGIPVNIGNPGEFTVRELADMVLSLTTSASPLEFKALPVDDPRRRKPDIARATELLGWYPRVPLADGLLPTIEWFRGYPSAQEALSIAAPPQYRHAGARSWQTR